MAKIRMEGADPRRLVGRVVRAIPPGRILDRIRGYILFYVAHGRLPRRGSGLFNDYLFFLRNSPAIEDALRQFTSDKILVKTWVEAVVGPGLTPRTLKVFEDARDLTAEALPDHCVVKPAHLSGLILYVDKTGAPPDPARLEELRATWNQNLYAVSRERNYRNLRSRLICEEVVEGAAEIKDYKVFCYRGRPRAIQVDVDRHRGHRRIVYTTDWRQMPVTYNKPPAPPEPVPERLGEMLEVAARLAADFESLRVDFYIAGDRIYVGELTHCPEQGHGRFGSRAEEKIFSDIYFAAPAS